MNSIAPNAPQDPAEVRRSQILEAAAGVFAERGYARATMKEIAARAGVAPGTIYLYFENKRDLLLSIADQLIGQAWDQTRAQMAGLDSEAYIAAILRNTLDFVRQHRSFIQALATEIWTDDRLQEQFFSHILGPIFDTGAGYLQAEVSAGRARPSRIEIVIPTIAGSVIILSVIHALAPDSFLSGFSEDELVDELTRLYFYGLRPCSGEAAE